MGWYPYKKGPPGVSSSGPSRAQNSLDLKHRSAPVFSAWPRLAAAVKSEKLFRLKNKKSCCNDASCWKAVSISTPMAFSLSMFERCEVRPL